MKPEATLGIRFRNPGRHFRLALESVFARTFQNWDLILLNDIYNDGSLELGMKSDDPRVRVFNDGHGKSLNLRLNEMVRLDAGTVFHANRRIVAIMERAHGPDEPAKASPIVHTEISRYGDHFDFYGRVGPTNGPVPNFGQEQQVVCRTNAVRRLLCQKLAGVAPFIYLNDDSQASVVHRWKRNNKMLNHDLQSVGGESANLF